MADIETWGISIPLDPKVIALIHENNKDYRELTEEEVDFIMNCKDVEYRNG